MRKFTSFQKIEQYANKKNFTILATELHGTTIKLKHLDGTKFKMINALPEEVILIGKDMLDERVVIVYSEHHLPLVYCLSDLKKVPTIKRKK